MKQGISRLAFNSVAGGVWGQSEVPNSDFVLAHVFATNDPNQPVIAIQGQASYTTLSSARLGSVHELANLFLVGLPFAEYVAIGTVIYQTDNTYDNGCKARIRTTDTGDPYVDWRSVDLSPASGPSDHLNLLNIGVNPHVVIDAHLASAANPHSVTFAQVKTGDVETIAVSGNAGAKSVILVDAALGAVVVTMPAAAASAGLTYTVKKLDASANTVTLAGTIEGVTDLVLSAQGEVARVVCDGAEWWVI